MRQFVHYCALFGYPASSSSLYCRGMGGVHPVRADAICSFNPVYAQGMTVAAMDALALRDALQGGDQDLRRRFFATAAKGIGQAWQIAVGSGLALPEVERTRTVSMRLANVYTEWALAATESNRYVAGQFWKVMNTVDVQTRLHRPSVMLRVAIANVRRSLCRERRMRCSVMLGEPIGCVRHVAVSRRLARRHRGVVPDVTSKDWVMSNRSPETLNPAAPMALSPAERVAPLTMSVTTERQGRL